MCIRDRALYGSAYNANIKIFNNLKRVKTFTDLGEVSELEYILPDFEETKYIACLLYTSRCV